MNRVEFFSNFSQEVAVRDKQIAVELADMDMMSAFGGAQTSDLEELIRAIEYVHSDFKKLLYMKDLVLRNDLEGKELTGQHVFDCLYLAAMNVLQCHDIDGRIEGSREAKNRKEGMVMRYVKEVRAKIFEEFRGRYRFYRFEDGEEGEY
ncbi:MAG: hypothetical protein US89_C0006G0067 [Candidatus Peregrinibacteria bacterium GW2011_GWF2_38_29]|nr:MAG: hypothetical protein US89_C0006G0067 [Candidatus Peregrinibacteria bacterium GW2011_GWF2_38_29]HBB03258.1 hypothetical protein [Candidatus Peregrinibacteria bacterium]